MNRPLVAVQWLGLTIVVVLMVAFAWLAMTPDSANAQAAEPAVVTVATEPVDISSVVYLAVGVEPGTTTLSGLTAAVSYDTNELVFIGCAVSGAGACNAAGDGVVKFSVFALAGIDANAELFTASFTSRSGAYAPTPMALEIIEAIDRQALALEGIVIETRPVDGGSTTQAVPAPPAFVRDAPVDVTPPPATNQSAGGAGQASITGSVIDRSSGAIVATALVCATQPLVLTEACVVADAAGHFELSGLGTGNYMLTASDSAGMYAASEATLVGVVSPAIRDGIVIRLDSN